MSSPEGWEIRDGKSEPFQSHVAVTQYLGDEAYVSTSGMKSEAGALGVKQ
jgi:hypothetical protein